ncbi:hypothetical protein [Anaeromyxobacter oryzae]|uniref:Outer membrane protein beta-barrel domain-containing protein n=1 Tax=Anaeromyxobacter oryzae TaxID=2918170 RepID=A0ABM7WWR9_9BACT|nr:hypothetical protein [Anaeromyxobacter oryzae]BDG03965.1 hypothetical protein AMOR_29610 [Anaeromyxobacter oryzae]
MPRLHALVLSAAALALAGGRATAQEGGHPTLFTASASIAGGSELGLDHGKPGLGEAEVAAGLESADLGLRGELAATLGFAPDSHVALRPGIRYRLPGMPIQLRAALDAADSRGHGFRWRWLLVGVATELRVTSLMGLYAELDTGAPLNADAGLPLLFRAGASFRF